MLADVAGRVRARSGLDVVTFEHGSYSFRDKGGACHDHAHIHVVATDRPVADFVAHVSAIVDLRRCDDWVEAAADMVAGESRSYLALAGAGGAWIAPATGAPSGFFRKALMTWLGGDPAEHDWLVFPQVERLRAMVSAGL